METIEDLKQNFVNLVLAHNLAFDSGNSSKANHLHNKIVALYRKIQQTDRLAFMLPRPRAVLRGNSHGVKARKGFSRQNDA